MASAMTRWICRNIDIRNGGSQVVIIGTGWQFLWRGLVYILGSLLIVPIPCLAVWFMRWITGNIVLIRVSAPLNPAEARAEV